MEVLRSHLSTYHMKLLVCDFEASTNKLSDHLGTIVNGRYDMFCPPQTAWELRKGLPNSRLFIIEAAGHAQVS